MSDKQLMVTAAVGIAVIVGIVALLSGGITGNSFAINAFTAPMPIYRQSDFSGFEYGPYQIPFSTKGFLQARQHCSPDNIQMNGYRFNQYECCVSACSDVCRPDYYPATATCVNQCTRACSQ